jgi:hypothetical protein
MVDSHSAEVFWSWQVRFAVCHSVAHAVGLAGLSAPSLFAYTPPGRLSLNVSGVRWLLAR